MRCGSLEPTSSSNDESLQVLSKLSLRVCVNGSMMARGKDLIGLEEGRDSIYKR